MNFLAHNSHRTRQTQRSIASCTDARASPMPASKLQTASAKRWPTDIADPFDPPTDATDDWWQAAQGQAPPPLTNTPVPKAPPTHNPSSTSHAIGNNRRTQRPCSTNPTDAVDATPDPHAQKQLHSHVRHPRAPRKLCPPCLRRFNRRRNTDPPTPPPQPATQSQKISPAEPMHPQHDQVVTTPSLDGTTAVPNANPLGRRLALPERRRPAANRRVAGPPTAAPDTRLARHTDPRARRGPARHRPSPRLDPNHQTQAVTISSSPLRSDAQSVDDLA